MNGIKFYSKDIEFQLVNENKYRKWLNLVARSENFQIGEIIYNFVSRDNIIEVNSKYLKHNYITDIITFDDTFLNSLKGQIFICVEEIHNNCISYENGSFERELNRVVVHGLLHLIGYNDKSEEEVRKMRGKENFYLELL